MNQEQIEMLRSIIKQEIEAAGRVKFTQITRVICPRTGTHFLDAVDTDGQHWSCEMATGIEKWIVYTQVWRKDPQQPYDQ
jgi:hypothetical protein